MSLLRRARVIHEKPRPPGVTAVGATAAALGSALFAHALLVSLRELPRDLPSLEPLLPSLAAGSLLLLSGVGLLRRWRRALFLALGLALAGAAGSGAGLGLGLAPLGSWGWLLALWYCLLTFLYLRQKRVAETF